MFHLFSFKNDFKNIFVEYFRSDDGLFLKVRTIWVINKTK